ncbi:4Fe-4S dicluster domain-containing protein [Anaerobranca gottschalkii]|uniref:4Fe-4S binding domain-containing protein n=1 Tax=Anaerobranca gottschalkii DSM 13577 TaxID=1120990 RepID=A0A1H9Y871_9FIRM|nr:4Fe-4S dicluster domain-containing protein [Anaerobranca gottschalkii]SES65138.1 4Fe-4S binding domain-containing protein [Anaerobranca gottschalkii DSM 13577]
MLKKTGIPTDEELKKVFPSEERIKQGPVAIFECFQEIPCNPCESSCPKGAVKIGEDINKIPVVNHDICNGCTNCVGACPGLAIFVVEQKGDKGKVTIPYEFLPLPKEGELVIGLDRRGEPVTKCKVIKIRNNSKLDRTAVITLEVEKGKENIIRFIKVEE